MTAKIAVLCVFICLFNSLNAQLYRRPVEKEFNRLDIDAALVLQRSIDYCPIWSETSDTLFVNILGNWRSFEIDRLSLIPATVKNREIGFNNNEILSGVDSATINNFDLEQCNDFMTISELNGVVAKVEQHGFSSELTISINGKKHYSQHSGGEVYHSPRISPDGKYLAFIAEMNGIMLIQLPDTKVKGSKVDKSNNKALNLYFDKGPEAAIPQFEKTLALESTDRCALYNLIVCTMEVKDFDSTAALIEKSKRHDPDYYERDFLEALFNFLNEEHDQTLALCNALITNHPYYSLPYYLAFTLYEKTEDLDSFCHLYQQGWSIKAIANDPSYTEKCE